VRLPWAFFSSLKSADILNHRPQLLPDLLPHGLRELPLVDLRGDVLGCLLGWRVPNGGCCCESQSLSSSVLQVLQLDVPRSAGSKTRAHTAPEELRLWHRYW
jgi:hypothetical protein